MSAQAVLTVNHRWFWVLEEDLDSYREMSHSKYPLKVGIGNKKFFKKVSKGLGPLIFTDLLDLQVRDIVVVADEKTNKQNTKTIKNKQYAN